MSILAVGTNTLYQAGSGNIIGATTIVTTSFSDIYGNVLTMANFGAKGFLTLEPDTVNQEFVTFSGVIANANGTYSLTGIKTVLAVSPYTESVGTVRQHSGGTKVVISDQPEFWSTFGQTANQNTWADIQTFSVPPISATNPTGNTQVANKQYVDGVAVSGAPNANLTTKGIVQSATQAQADAKTATGSTGAALVVTPDVLRSSLLSDYVADTGSANAYAIAPSPAITAYTTGQIFSFKAANANTGASTLNVNSLGTKSIKVNKSYDPAPNYFLAGSLVILQYDGTNFQILSVTAQPQVSQNGQEIYAASGASSGTTYTATLSPAPTAYTTGMVVRFKADAANTGAATLNVNSLGAIALKKNASSALVANDIATGQFIEAIYDGTNFEIISPVLYQVPGYEQVTNTGTGPSTIGASVTVTVTCSAGKKVIGGGGTVATPAGCFISSSWPAATNQWSVTYTSSVNNASGTITAYAIAIDVN